jgi:hypothetical protein
LAPGAAFTKIIIPPVIYIDKAFQSQVPAGVLACGK